jgi:hypothetical protein
MNSIQQNIVLNVKDGSVLVVDTSGNITLGSGCSGKDCK